MPYPGTAAASAAPAINWSRVDVDAMPQNNLWVVYGHEFTGKSTFACTFPEPIYWIAASGGGWRAWQNFPDKEIFCISVPPLTIKPEPYKKTVIWTADQDSAKKSASIIMEAWNSAIKQNRGTLVLDDAQATYDYLRAAEFGRMSHVDQKAYGAVTNQTSTMLQMALKDAGCRMDVVIVEQLVEKWTRFTSKDGDEQRGWDGETYERKGFKHSGYKADIILECLRDQGRGGDEQWGVQIKHKCGPEVALCGQSYWGEEATYDNLMAEMYE